MGEGSAAGTAKVHRVTSCHQMAQLYAKAGFHVFPCRPGGKEPLTARGHREATTNPGQIDAWWRQWPDANVAIVPGKSGHVVLDVDTKRGAPGRFNLELQTVFRGPLADDGDLCRVETPSGGEHIWFKLPEGMEPPGNQRLDEGIDVRSGSGYVVAPPSRTGEGRYQWRTKQSPTRAPVIPAAWSEDMVPAGSRDPTKPARKTPADEVDELFLDHPADVQRAVRHAQTAPPAVEGQEGSLRTYRVACELRSLGLSEETCFDVMAKWYNPRCDPPWDDRSDASGPGALIARVASAYRNAQEPEPGEHALGDHASPANAFADIPATPKPAQIGPATQTGKNGQVAHSSGQVAHSSGQVALSHVDEIERQSKPAGLLTVGGLDNMPYLEWDIDGVLPRRSLVTLYGEPGTTKSFQALDWATRLALGQDWGDFVVPEPRRVLYVTNEGTSGLRNRWRAWRTHNNVETIPPAAGTENQGGLNIAVEMPRLSDETLWAEWVGDIKSQGPFDVIVFDTLAHLMVGLEENSNSDVMTAITRLTRLRDELNATVILVHHSGKGGTIRGASAVVGACDAIYTMEQAGKAGGTAGGATGGVITLRMTKMKDGDRWRGTLDIVPHQYEVGHDSKGKPMTSLAVEPGPWRNVPSKQESAQSEAVAKQYEQAAEREAEANSQAAEVAELVKDIRRILEASSEAVMTERMLVRNLAAERMGDRADASVADLEKTRLRKYSYQGAKRWPDLHALVRMSQDGRNGYATHYGLPPEDKKKH